MTVRDLLAEIEKWRETVPSIDDYAILTEWDADLSSIIVDPHESAVFLLVDFK